MTIGDALPHINAVMNATSCVAIATGYVAIKSKRVDIHQRCMLTAVVASGIFLAGYLTRFALTGTHRFPDAGAIKVVYLVLLFSHMLLAIAVVPIVFRMLFLASRRRFADHRRLGRIGLPIWLYVSVSGVVVYAMLYHVAPRLVERHAPPVAAGVSAFGMR